MYNHNLPLLEPVLIDDIDTCWFFSKTMENESTGIFKIESNAFGIYPFVTREQELLIVN